MSAITKYVDWTKKNVGKKKNGKKRNQRWASQSNSFKLKLLPFFCFFFCFSLELYNCYTHGHGQLIYIPVKFFQFWAL